MYARAARRTTPAESIAPDPAERACLAPLLLDAWRETRLLRAEAVAYAELLQLTLAQLHDLDRELDRVRERYHALLDDRRRRERERPAA